MWFVHDIFALLGTGHRRCRYTDGQKFFKIRLNHRFIGYRGGPGVNDTMGLNMKMFGGPQLASLRPAGEFFGNTSFVMRGLTLEAQLQA